MKELLQRAKWIGAVEIVVSTAIYGIFFYLLTYEDIRGFSVYDSLLPYPNAYAREFSEATILYAAFLFMNFYVVPRLIRRERIFLDLLWSALTIAAIVIVFGTIEHGVGALALFGTYLFVKFGSLYLWFTSDAIQRRFPFLAPGVFLTVIFWLISLGFLIVSEADRDLMAFWGTMVPSAILLYSFSFFSLIPRALRKKRPLLSYVWNVFWILALAELPVWLLNFWIASDEVGAIMSTFFNSLIQFLATMPFAWIFYMRYKRGTEELLSLKTALGHSAAKLDFLQSQINPHFLFNALNTLYGMAIQEKAERTSEAIQKLGDMMRFMLHENLQPRILVVREIEYLKNYISLQKLRTDTIASVSIHIDIAETNSSLQISPMLLIPLVENAFKHGISLREPSYIRIVLDINDKTLTFDVSNSNHPKSNEDPERDKSGIGLNNVRQRLNLLYPNRHELTIRETSREFFVHLTIRLS